MAKAPLIISSVYGLYLPVRDMKKSLDFYRDCLGFVPRKGPSDTIFFSINGFHLVLEEVKTPFTPIRIVLKVSPFQFNGISDVLANEGYEIEGPIYGRDQQVIRLLDPDGHMLEITAFCKKEELKLVPPSQKTTRPKDRHSPNRWESFYATTPVQHMPWYSESLDEELEYYLYRYAPLPGRMLELGCGAGTQAARLAAIGYVVVGIDIAPDAIRYAEKTYGDLNPRLTFEVRDVTGGLEGIGVFDYAFDRGCFHTLEPAKRQSYVENIGKVLKKGGILFLKTFSTDEPGSWGPYRFAPEDINRYFGAYFDLLEQKNTYFDGTLEQKPKGIISVLRRKE